MSDVRTADAFTDQNHRTALAYAECFAGETGRRVLEHLREHALRVRRIPREGMSMQETALFTLGEQSLFHTVMQNVENGRKVRERG